MDKRIRHVSLRIDSELLRRFEYVAGYHDRSVNKMMVNLIRRCITEFEEENGAIPRDENGAEH